MTIKISMTIKTYIYKYIILKIMSGEWKPGDQLPSENQLAIQFSCSRLTARHVLTSLVNNNIIMAQKGKGYILLKQSYYSIFESYKDKYQNITTDIKEIKSSEKTKYIKLLNEKYFKYDFFEKMRPSSFRMFLKKYQDAEGLVCVQVILLNKNKIRYLTLDGVKKSVVNTIAFNGVIPTHDSSEFLFKKETIVSKFSSKLQWESKPIIKVRQLYANKSIIQTSVTIERKDVFKILQKRSVIF